MSRLRALLCSLAAVMLLASCAGGRGSGDDGYAHVEADITYGAHDQRAREWDALMVALDRCHQQGYADAQAAAAPQTRCLENGPDGCQRSAAHITWDCIGMGYQPN